MNAHEDGSARARFRVVAPVGRAPVGARWALTSDTFAQSFRDAFAGLEVQVADTLGAGSTRTITWSPRGLSDLTLSGVIRADATLSALAELVKSMPRTIDAGWLEKLIAIVGEGTLARECRELLEPPPPPPGAEPEVSTSVALSETGEKGEIEALFERAEAAAKPVGASAVDAFVQAMRGAPGPSPSKSAASPDGARRVRDHLERAVFRVARAVLDDPTLARMESSWRALRWFVEQSPASSGGRLEIIDAPSERALELLRAIPYDGDFEDPDLFAVVPPVADVETLRALAELAEERLAPCIVSRDPARDADQLLDWLGSENAARELRALRAEEASRWLCIAHNEAVLFDEGAGELARTVLGSPVWALLASIAASYRATGSFARIVGQAGQLRAPATTTLSTGRDAGTALPTRHFTSIRAQSELEALGVLGLGSPRNSDRISLSSAPMVRGAADAVPLPAQIWAGRIARFTEWVRGQLPPDASSDTAREIFEQAASVFLYPGAERSAMLTAEIVESGGRRALQVGARIHSSHALVPLDLEFAVPLA